MTVGDAGVQPVVLSGGGMLLRAIKAKSKTILPVVAAYRQVTMAVQWFFACAALDAAWGLIR
jgi:hypothetical protein